MILEQGSTLDWISSFLSNRTQQVICGGDVSDPVGILSGVPQGSVLGPLLFLIYIKYLTVYNLHVACLQTNVLFTGKLILFKIIWKNLKSGRKCGR